MVMSRVGKLNAACLPPSQAKRRCYPENNHTFVDILVLRTKKTLTRLNLPSKVARGYVKLSDDARLLLHPG